MEIQIRQAVPEDATAITALTEQLGYSLSEKRILENINLVLKNKDKDVFVAIINNAVIGWIGLSYSIQIETEPFCEINGLVIDENQRGKGVGKLLIEKAKQWCNEKGNNKLRLRCNVKRTETHLFYQHIGFTETKQQKIFEIDVS